MNFFRTILLVALATVILTRDASGQVPTQNFVFGSTNIVADHAAKMTDQFWLSIYQPQTGGGIIDLVEVKNIRGFTNMNDLNSWLQWSVTKYATNVLVVTNVDFNKQFTAYVSAVDWADGFYSVAYCNYPFYLVKNGTNYNFPDFSSISMSLESDMPYHTTNINWAVMQVYNLASNTVVDIRDSRYEDPSTSIVDYYHQLLVIPTAYASGNFKFRLSIESGTNQYRVFGAQGNQIPELPNTISLPVIAKGTNALQVTAGDVGRVLVLQGTTNLASWIDLTGHTNYYTGYDPGFSYSEKVVSPGHFFRLKITAEQP
jgi:hypothetical protein